MQNSSGAAGIVVAVVAIGVVVRRQLRTRPVSRAASLVALLATGAFGVAGIVFGIASVAKYRSLHAPTIGLLLVSLAAAALFGAARARTVEIWLGPQSEVLRKGTPATTGLWLVSGGMHIGLALWIDQTAGIGMLGTASLYAYLAIGLGAQDFLVLRRGARL